MVQEGAVVSASGRRYGSIAVWPIRVYCQSCCPWPALAGSVAGTKCIARSFKVVCSLVIGMYGQIFHITHLSMRVLTNSPFARRMDFSASAIVNREINSRVFTVCACFIRARGGVRCGVVTRKRAEGWIRRGWRGREERGNFCAGSLES